MATEVLNEYLAVIEEEADRLTDLIDQLLEASRLQSGTFQLRSATSGCRVGAHNVTANSAARPIYIPSGAFWIRFPLSRATNAA